MIDGMGELQFPDIFFFKVELFRLGKKSVRGDLITMFKHMKVRSEICLIRYFTQDCNYN